MLTFIVVLGVAILAVRAFARLESELTRLRQRLDALERRLDAQGDASATSTAASAAAVPAIRAPDLPPSSSADARISAIPSPPAVPRAPARAHDFDSAALERTIGEQLLLYAGAVVLLLGIAFFLRYAFEREWISPVVRVLLGVVAGGVLVALGRAFALRGYRGYGLILSGAGLVALYLSIYAALNFYALLPAPLAFIFLLLTTVGAAWLADRHAAVALAVLAVSGGFLTPFLVGGQEDAQLTLFSYDALLIAGTMYIAQRRDWPLLNLLSLLMTGVTVTAWSLAYYTAEKALRTELFLTLYCVMFLLVLRATLRSRRPGAEMMSRVLLGAPIAYHFVSVVILSSQGAALPAYLIVATVAALIIAVQADIPLLRLIAWAGVALPLGQWLDDHQTRAWVVASIVTVAAVYGAHLASQLHVSRQHNGQLSGVDVSVIHLNGIGVFAALYGILVPWAPLQLPLLAAALAIWNAGIAWAVRRRWPVIALHWCTVAFTLAAVAVALEWDGPWVLVMWTIEGAGAMYLGHRVGRDWFRVTGWLLLALSIVRWLQPDLQATTTAFTVIWNARALSGLFVVTVFYVLAFVLGTGEDVARPRRRAERAAFLVAANTLTVAVISTEIASFWELREAQGGAGYLARQAMLSGAWALYAALTLTVGMRRQYAPLRYFAIVLFALTVGKVFVVDLATLGGIYRIAGLVLVGVVLLFASFLYQRGKGAAES